MSKDKNALFFTAVFCVFVAFVFFRTDGLMQQGFHDSDEYAKHLFYSTDYILGKYNDVSGSFWARPTGHFLNILLGKIFSFSVQVYNIKTFIFSFLTVLVAFLLARRFYNDQTALVFVGLISASYTLIYWSRTSKEIAVSGLFYLLAIYLLHEIFFKFEIRRKVYSYSLSLGLLVGLMITSHPNTIPSAIVLSFLVFIKVGCLSGIKLNDKIVYLMRTGLGVIALPIFYEIYFILVKINPVYGGNKEIGYFKFLIYHANIANPVENGLNYYWSILSVENSILSFITAPIIVLGFLVMNNNDKIKAILLTLLAICPALIFVVGDSFSSYRNIALNLYPLYLLIGVSLTGIVGRLIK